MRTIKVYSTRGGSQTIKTDVKTWGELRPLVEEHYDLSNLQATENINKATLQHADAVLPAEDFKLWLRPIQTKSGLYVENLSFKDMRKLVDSDEIKKFLNNYIEGKNWTQLSVKELRNGLTEYNPLKETSSENNDSVNLNSVIDNVQEILDNSNDEFIVTRLEEIIEELNDLQEYIDNEDEDFEDDELDDEFREFEEGFLD